MEGRDHTGQAAAPFTVLLPMAPGIPDVRTQIRVALYLSHCFRCYWRVSFVLFFLQCHRLPCSSFNFLIEDCIYRCPFFVLFF